MMLLDKARHQKLTTLASFLPRAVLEDLATLTPEAAAQMQPSCRTLEGAVVVLFDLCSFTKLAEGLRRGKILLLDSTSAAGALPRPNGVAPLASPTSAAAAAAAGGGEGTGTVNSGGDISRSYSSALLSAKILRLQSTEEAQAGYGAEQLKDLLKVFFQELMGTLTDYGGDVMRLAGDALIAIFHDGNKPGAGGVPDARLLQRAALVSMLALRRLDGRVIQGLSLHLHVAVGVGPVDLYVVGDRRVGWHYVAAGEPFKSLDTALDDGKAGEMVVSPALWAGMQGAQQVMQASASSNDYDSDPEWEGSQPSPRDAEDDAADKGQLDREALRSCYAWRARTLPSGNIMLDSSATAEALERVLHLDAAEERLRGNDYAGAAAAAAAAVLRKADVLERVVRLFTLPPILYACEAETSGWFAELHRVVVIFVNITLDHKPDLASMQRVFAVLQGTMRAYHGVIKEFSQDDKGIVMVGAMGLPPVAGANPAVRACSAALRMVAGLDRIGAHAYVGISMGQVFTASIGSARREFGMFGDVVNTAARLMGAGKKDASLVAAAAAAAQHQRRHSATSKLVLRCTKLLQVEVDTPLIAAAATAAQHQRRHSATSNSKGGPSSSLKTPLPADGSAPPHPDVPPAKKGVIVVEAVVRSAAHMQVEFISGGHIAVKGKDEKLEVYMPVREKPQIVEGSGADDPRALVGHRGLRARLITRISQLTQGLGGGMVILQGAPGIGKSRLLSVFARDWRRQRVAVLGMDPFLFPATIAGRRSSMDDAGHNQQRSASDASAGGDSGFSAWRAVVRDVVLLLRARVLASAGYVLPQSATPPPASPASQQGGGDGGGVRDSALAGDLLVALARAQRAGGAAAAVTGAGAAAAATIADDSAADHRQAPPPEPGAPAAESPPPPQDFTAAAAAAAAAAEGAASPVSDTEQYASDTDSVHTYRSQASGNEGSAAAAAAPPPLPLSAADASSGGGGGDDGGGQKRSLDGPPLSVAVRRRSSIVGATAKQQQEIDSMAGTLHAQVGVLRALASRSSSLHVSASPRHRSADAAMCVASSPPVGSPAAAAAPVRHSDNGLCSGGGGGGIAINVKGSALPWWAGAFQDDAVADGLVDSREARGEYLHHFCRVCTPQEPERATRVLCDMLMGARPLPSVAPLPPPIHPPPPSPPAMGGTDYAPDAERAGHPDREQFDVLLGVVTMAALADGGLPLLVVMDGAHQMDPQSGDLLKATLKYLGERVLFIVTTPPLPPRAGPALRSRRRRSSGPSHRAGRDSSSGGMSAAAERVAGLNGASAHDKLQDAVPEDDEEGSDEDSDGYSNDDSTDDEQATAAMDDFDGDEGGAEPSELKARAVIRQSVTNDVQDAEQRMQLGAAAFMGGHNGSGMRLAANAAAATVAEAAASALHKRGGGTATATAAAAAAITAAAATANGAAAATGLAGVVAAVSKRAACQVLRVGPLGYRQCEDLAGGLLGGVRVSALAALVLYLRCQGNPFYLAEYCRFARGREGRGGGEGGAQRQWTLSSSKNVCRVLQGAMPSAVETKVLDFLGCLTAQQLFVLKVLSAMGAYDISVAMLEEVYPIPVVPGCPLLADVLALEACKIVWVQEGGGNGGAAAMTVSFRDLVLHQVVYQKLSHQHRRDLHARLAEYYLDQQKKAGAWEGDADGGGRGSPRVASADITPLLVHHLTLAHREQKAMIRAHVIGVRELEAWAVKDFQKLLHACLPPLPAGARALARANRDLMWLSPAVVGILKTLAAIRSGQGVSSATRKFRSRVEERRSGSAYVAAGTLPKDHPIAAAAAAVQAKETAAAAAAATPAPSATESPSSKTAEGGSSSLRPHRSAPPRLTHVPVRSATAGASRTASSPVRGAAFEFLTVAEEAERRTAAGGGARAATALTRSASHTVVERAGGGGGGGAAVAADAQRRRPHTTPGDERRPCDGGGAHAPASPPPATAACARLWARQERALRRLTAAQRARIEQLRLVYGTPLSGVLLLKQQRGPLTSPPPPLLRSGGSGDRGGSSGGGGGQARGSRSPQRRPLAVAASATG
ncbi:hypothetical protein JKP88DRAFT_331957 [Tribonema minus]|uniref:Guanylate cyclase domain-containing protein n=1 Tax=Tribonema minus TaxID=303371 RepID=A0A835YQ74_9STRA|nr:hypothetical protein JKP88DRAFT_331957 [Tribonema minus]